MQMWKRQTDEVMLNYCVNIQTCPFSCLLFERLLFLLLFQSLSHLHNTCGLMDGGRREGGEEGRRKGRTEGECQVLCCIIIIKLHKLYTLMKSGRLNGGFSMPLFPWRYFLLKHQWRGTGTELRVDCQGNRRRWRGDHYNEKH